MPRTEGLTRKATVYFQVSLYSNRSLSYHQQRLSTLRSPPLALFEDKELSVITQLAAQNSSRGQLAGRGHTSTQRHSGDLARIFEVYFRSSTRQFSMI